MKKAIACLSLILFAGCLSSALLHAGSAGNKAAETTGHIHSLVSGELRETGSHSVPVLHLIPRLSQCLAPAAKSNVPDSLHGHFAAVKFAAASQMTDGLLAAFGCWQSFIPSLPLYLKNRVLRL